MTTILVTGASGFTGHRLVERLLNEDVQVRGLVRNSHAAKRLRTMGAVPFVGDLRDPASLSSPVKGADVVFHIAALFRDGRASRMEMWDTNVQGTENILLAAQDAGVERFVHCSTVGVYGNIENPPANENSPLSPGDDYQASKLAGEQIVAEVRGISAVIARPAGIYGPGDMRFLKLFRAIQRRRFVMIGSGNVIYHFTYIDDLIEGLLKCSHYSGDDDFILAGSEIVTLNELVTKIANLLDVPRPWLRIPFAPVYLAGAAMELAAKPLGLSPPLYRRRVDFFRKNRGFAINKAKRILGYEPQVDLETGLRRTAAWYGQQGLLRDTQALAKQVS